MTQSSSLKTARKLNMFSSSFVIQHSPWVGQISRWDHVQQCTWWRFAENKTTWSHQMGGNQKMKNCMCHALRTCVGLHFGCLFVIMKMLVHMSMNFSQKTMIWNTFSKLFMGCFNEQSEGPHCSPPIFKNLVDNFNSQSTFLCQTPPFLMWTVSWSTQFQVDQFDMSSFGLSLRFKLLHLFWQRICQCVSQNFEFSTCSTSENWAARVEVGVRSVVDTLAWCATELQWLDGQLCQSHVWFSNGGTIQKWSFWQLQMQWLWWSSLLPPTLDFLMSISLFACPMSQKQLGKLWNWHVVLVFVKIPAIIDLSNFVQSCSKPTTHGLCFFAKQAKQKKKWHNEVLAVAQMTTLGDLHVTTVRNRTADCKMWD